MIDTTCPECGGPMVSRKNGKDGTRFFGCKKYPDCRGTRNTDGEAPRDRRRPFALDEGDDTAGYGVFSVGSRTDGTRRILGAHQFSCELAHGPLKTGEEPHHTCHNKSCVNGAHLVPMSRADHDREHTEDRRRIGRRNSQRQEFIGSSAHARSQKTHCGNGHLYEENSYYRVRTGERACKTCLKACGIRSRIKKGQRVTPELLAWLADFNRAASAYKSQRAA